MGIIWIIWFMVPLALTVWVWIPAFKHPSSLTDDYGISRVFVTVASFLVSVLIWCVFTVFSAIAIILTGIPL